MSPAWSVSSLPRLDGKTALVTGSTGGLGFEVAAGLAGRGARVILSGRTQERGRAALDGLAARVPSTGARNGARFEALDLASLDAVAGFAGRLLEAGEPIHLLANNAGVLAPSRRLTTKDGFELQFGTNHLGHFALTGRLLPLLAAGEAVVMTVASLAAKQGEIPFGDLNARHRYNPMARYRQSKLCNLIFALELNRRARGNSWPIHSRAAHPGWAASDIVTRGDALLPAGSFDGARRIARSLSSGIFKRLAQSVEHGAWPLLYALASPQAGDGRYYGPQGRGERKGPPGPAFVPPLALDHDLAARLWRVSEEMTGVRYNI